MLNQPTRITALALLALAGCSASPEAVDLVQLRGENTKLRRQIAAFEAERATTALNLSLFDELDLSAFNGRDMERLAEIHADDVVVYNPDGKTTRGMDPHHAAELRFLFDKFDLQIPVHLVQFGHADWTAGISICEGTWREPITLPDGTVLEPTGREVRIKVATIARWEDGRIAEEYLFWDNADWNRQVGLER
ncbi:MAG: ester cyclase [Planctomycetota bacterium]